MLRPASSPARSGRRPRERGAVLIVALLIMAVIELARTS